MGYSLGHVFQMTNEKWNNGALAWDGDKTPMAIDWMSRVIKAKGAWTWNVKRSFYPYILHPEDVALLQQIYAGIPTESPTLSPTTTPTATPIAAPTTAPTSRPTAAPTAAPNVATAAPTESKSGPITCMNDDDFRINKKKKKHCAFITWKEGRQTRLCQMNKVRVNCPSSCGIDGCCTDRAAFRFKNDKQKRRSCEWVDVKLKRRTTYCEMRRVKSECVKTCNNCQPFVVKPP